MCRRGARHPIRSTQAPPVSDVAHCTGQPASRTCEHVLADEVERVMFAGVLAGTKPPAILAQHSALRATFSVANKSFANARDALRGLPMAPLHAAPGSPLACHDARRWRSLPTRPATMGLTRYGPLTTVAPWCRPYAGLSWHPGSEGSAAAVQVQTLACHTSPQLRGKGLDSPQRRALARLEPFQGEGHDT
jgi:hypothetical protein